MSISFLFRRGRIAISIAKLTQIANHVLEQKTDVNFEILCGLAEAYDLGMEMTKEQLVEFLRQNLTIRIEVDGRFKIPDPDRIVRVKLLLCNEEISKDEAYLD